MDPVTSNPLLGVAMHAVGATFAATRYTPEKRVKGWSLQCRGVTHRPIGAALAVLIVAVLLLKYGNLRHGSNRGNYPWAGEEGEAPAELGKPARQEPRPPRDCYPKKVGLEPCPTYVGEWREIGDK